MGIAKENTTLGKSIQIGRDCLGMTFETANPIVEVVDADQEDVGRCALELGCEVEGNQ